MRLALALTALLAAAPATESAGPRLAPFSAAEGAIPAAWEPLEFPKVPRHTDYQLVEDDGVQVVRAQSRDAASGLIHPLDVDLRRHPILRWRWKVAAPLPAGDVRQRDGDDYSARVYVAFRYEADKLSFRERLLWRAAQLVWGDLPARALTYVWTAGAEAGAIYPSPYTGFSRMVVARGAGEPTGGWVSEERNVYEDYQRAFPGEEPPRVAGVAIMTDTDDTGQSASAWYGDLSFASAPR